MLTACPLLLLAPAALALALLNLLVLCWVGRCGTNAPCLRRLLPQPRAGPNGSGWLLVRGAGGAAAGARHRGCGATPLLTPDSCHTLLMLLMLLLLPPLLLLLLTRDRLLLSALPLPLPLLVAFRICRLSCLSLTESRQSVPAGEPAGAAGAPHQHCRWAGAGPARWRWRFDGGGSGAVLPAADQRRQGESQTLTDRFVDPPSLLPLPSPLAGAGRLCTSMCRLVLDVRTSWWWSCVDWCLTSGWWWWWSESS